MKATNNEETKIETTNANVAERLPKLDEEQQTFAESRTSWAAWFWNAEAGYIHHDETAGVTWQVVEKGKIRCIRIWDDAHCYEGLSIMRASMQLVGLEVEVDPYVVVSPYITQPKSETQLEAIGPEVV